VVSTIDDTAFGPTSSAFSIELVKPSAGVLLGSRSRATVTIQDNEQRVQFTTSGPVVVGEGGSVFVTLTRTGTPNATVSVNYATASGSASTADYVADSGVVTFGPGVTSQAILVRTRDDSVFIENDEVFFVTLSNPTPPLQLGAPNLIQILIPSNAF
jgi:hypothetical protein